MPGAPTTNRGLPTIVGTDSPDVPRDFNALAAALEAEVGYLAQRSVLDVGMVGQTRAGRTLAPTDFLSWGGPLGLWNLSDLADASGNGHALTNKGAVPFAPGIEGAASSAAQFAGSTAQVLYRDDIDVFGNQFPRIRTGSWGCWFRTAKRGTSQVMLAKSSLASGQYGPMISVDSSNVVKAYGSLTGTDTFTATGISDVADDRWHFVVVTHDGAMFRLYVDGVMEAMTSANGTMWQSSAPFNVGGYNADAATATSSPFFGRIDEVFIIDDVLSEDQIRLLMAVKLPHGAARSPRRAGLAVRRLRRGPLLESADFPVAPLRGYNLYGTNDFGTQAQLLTPDPNTGSIVSAAGPDGSRDSAMFFSGTHFGAYATDAGLPAGTATRTYGLWFKTLTVSQQVLMGWGSTSTTDTVILIDSSGFLAGANGSVGAFGGSVKPSDGVWHHVVLVEDNAAADGLKRKLYCDGRLIAATTTLGSVTLGGAGRFRIGALPDGGFFPFKGQLARAFVTDQALTPSQIVTLYAKGEQDLGLSPKNPGDHIERIDATNIYFIGDTLDPQDRIELEVAA